MYSAILFDFDDTLVNYRLTRDRAGEAFARLFLSGIVDAPSFVAAFREENDAVWARFITDSPELEGVLEASYIAAARRLGLDGFADGRYAEEFLAALCACPVFEPGALELLDFLRDRCGIGIVTNGLKGIQRRRIEAAGLSSRCTGLAISGDLGLEKPDRRIFDYCLSALGVDPAGALYVGDSLETDLAGARNAGLDFCFYNPSGLPLVPSDGEIRYEIRGLLEIADIVGNGADGRSRRRA